MNARKVVTTLTLPEAAAKLGVCQGRAAALARSGDLDAVKIDGRWLVDGGSVAAYRRRTPRPPQAAPRVSAAPLLRQIELAGGDAAVGAGPAEQWHLMGARRTGLISLDYGDDLAVKLLGLTRWDLWPEAAA